MRRPLVIVALLYAGGIWLGDAWAVSLRWLFLLAFFFLPFCLRPGRAGAVLLGGVLVLSGWINLVRHTAVVAPHDLRAQFQGESQLIALRGRIQSMPVARSGGEWSRSHSVVDVSSVRVEETWIAARGRVLVTTRGGLETEFVQGRRVEIEGVLRRPRGAVTEAGFDHGRMRARQGIYFELDVASGGSWSLVESSHAQGGLLWATLFRDWSRQVLSQGLPEEDDSLRLMWAMVLGLRAEMADEVAESFRNSGTMHVFAISGLHIGMIAGILVSLCRVLRVPRAACFFLVVPFLWFYVAVTGWQSSAVRATVMMSIVVVGWSLHRPVDLLNSLAGAALVILLWDPQQLFQAGFQLSFSVVLSIGLLLPPCIALRDRLLRHDPLLPEELRSLPRRWLDGPFRYLLTSLAISVAAWLGSIPWMAWYFQIFTPVTLGANLLMVPLAGGVIASSLASLAFGAWLPQLSHLFNHSAWFWMTLMAHCSEGAAALPGAWVRVPPPPWYVLVLYYPMLAAIATSWLFHRGRLAVAGLAVLIVVGACLMEARAGRDAVRLTVLSLRGGDSLFFDAPGKTNDMLIDTGDAAAVRHTVLPFLLSSRVGEVPFLLLTHGDVRHVGGALMLLEEFCVERVVTSHLRFRSPYYRDIARHLETVPDQWQRVGRGDRVGAWEVLHPAVEDRFSKADDGAVVLRGTFHGTRVLLCSDLGRLGQRTLAERERDLGADLVMAGMPAVDEPLEDLFLEAIQPVLMVISSGESPATERPTNRLRERLEQHGVPVWFTGDHGAITLVLHPGGWEVRAMDGRRHQARRKAGRVDLGVARE
jgi:competence protein ComEC